MSDQNPGGQNELDSATIAGVNPGYIRIPPEDSESFIQGLTPAQIDVLAQKVYDLLLDELRIEGERYGRRAF